LDTPSYEIIQIFGQMKGYLKIGHYQQVEMGVHHLLRGLLEASVSISRGDTKKYAV
jgi:hypothetical protein